MAKVYSGLKEYLNDEYYDLLVNAAAGYVDKHKYEYKTEYIPFWTDEPEVDSCAITSLYTESEKTSDIVFIHCNVRVSVNISGFAKGSRHNDVDQDTIPTWLSMKLRAKFVESFEDMRVVDVRPLDEKEQFVMQKASTKCFVPYITDKDLEHHAEEFLKKYCPAALKTPMKLPLKDIVTAMGLTACSGNLSDGVFGKCYFIDQRYKDKNGTIQVIKRGTILCDKNAFFMNGVGSLSNTIIHECVHWDLHRRFFAFMHLLNPKLSAIACATLDSNAPILSPSLQEEYKWMEWQANALTPRILMPAEMTKLKYEQIRAEIVSGGETDLIKVYEETIRRLSDFFGVTLTSAKIRLLELGYDGLKGIHDYVDSKPTKPYLYNATKIKKEQTFSAGFYEAIANNALNLKLRECLEKRTIVYASGFFVINSRKYTYRDKETGRQELTDYALRHMDECCLVFDHEHKSTAEYSDRYYSMCYLCRRQGGKVNSKISAEDRHNSALLDEAETDADYGDEFGEIQHATRLVKEMNGLFSAALQYLMNEFKFSKASLMRETRIDDHKITKFLTDDNVLPTKKEVLAICAGMHLHPVVGNRLLQIASCQLNWGNEQDGMYNFLMNQCFDEGLDAWNERLNSEDRNAWTLP